MTESPIITGNRTVTPLNEVLYSQLKFDGAAFKKLEGLCVCIREGRKPGVFMNPQVFLRVKGKRLQF